MSYIFNRVLEDGSVQEELVEKEVWAWEAYYTDGSYIKQFDEKDGLFHQFSEINQSQLNLFIMRNETDKCQYSLIFNTDTKLIHFYRNVLLQNGSVRVRLYVFGYQDSAGKKLNVIMPDNSLVITDDISKIEIGEGV